MLGHRPSSQHPLSDSLRCPLAAQASCAGLHHTLCVHKSAHITSPAFKIYFRNMAVSAHNNLHHVFCPPHDVLSDRWAAFYPVPGRRSSSLFWITWNCKWHVSENSVCHVSHGDSLRCIATGSQHVGEHLSLQHTLSSCLLSMPYFQYILGAIYISLHIFSIRLSLFSNHPPEASGRWGE